MTKREREDIYIDGMNAELDRPCDLAMAKDRDTHVLGCICVYCDTRSGSYVLQLEAENEDLKSQVIELKKQLAKRVS